MLRRTRVLIFILSISTLSFAQKGTQTPYSILGLGELQFNEYAAYLSMGGVSMASTDSSMVNASNPASFSYFGRYRPVFQVGANGRLSTFETSTSSVNARHFGLNQFQLGIPIKKRWGSAIGIKPYSFTGYLISNYTVEDGDSTELYTNEGRGGVSNFHLGVAYQPVNFTKRDTVFRKSKDSTGLLFMDTLIVGKKHVLSIGANANYLFGSSDRIRSFQYWSSSLGLNSKVENSLRLSGLTYDFGINYEYKWTSTRQSTKGRRSNSFSIGATYTPGVNVRAFQDLFSYSYLNVGGFNGAEQGIDTVEFVDNNQGSIYIPESYKAGFEFRFGPNQLNSSSMFKIGGDVRYQTWSKYNEDFNGETFTNEMTDRLQFGLGFEFTPVVIPVPKKDPYISQIHYRLGFNYAQTQLQFETSPNNYTRLSSYGMSFGLGFPIRITEFSNTNINFGANLGNLGTTDDGLIREKYLGIFFGVSITPGKGNLWFLKRKYD